MAPWVYRELVRARRAGWTGRVVSGIRSCAQQQQAAARYAASLGKSVAEVYPHGPCASNHVGWRYPRGAVDVTEGPQLALVLSRLPPPKTGKALVWGGPVINDPPHFSSNGH